MASLGVKDDSSTAFLKLKYLIYIVMAAAAFPCTVTLQYNISGLIKEL